VNDKCSNHWSLVKYGISSSITTFARLANWAAGDCVAPLATNTLAPRTHYSPGPGERSQYLRGLMRAGLRAVEWTPWVHRCVVRSADAPLVGGNASELEHVHVVIVDVSCLLNTSMEDQMEYQRPSHPIQATYQLEHSIMPKPVILHLGDAIKYNHDLYNGQFCDRFEVVRNETENREQFIDALKTQRLVCVVLL